MMFDKIKDIVQSSHLNFLVGSGLSTPFFKTLGNIEVLLTELEQQSIPDKVKIIARASILKEYFELCIKRNVELLNDAELSKEVRDNYIKFLSTVSDIIANRRSKLLNMQVNIFTTNVDIFFEKSLEHAALEYNDGFTGNLSPKFGLTNFKKSIIKTSSHYGNESEIPLFNIYKMHGSVAWKIEGEEQKDISLDRFLTVLKGVQLASSKLTAYDIVSLYKADDVRKTLPEIIEESTKIKVKGSHKEFLAAYDRLAIINPTKEKFKFTTLNYTYYELLRMFSNELERENSVLFVMGFSFADEHIQEIISRVMNSNPTLIVCVFAYDENSKKAIESNMKIVGGFPKHKNLIFMPFDYKDAITLEAEESSTTVTEIADSLSDQFGPTMTDGEVDLFDMADMEETEEEDGKIVSAREEYERLSDPTKNLVAFNLSYITRSLFEPLARKLRNDKFKQK